MKDPQRIDSHFPVSAPVTTPLPNSLIGSFRLRGTRFRHLRTSSAPCLVRTVLASSRFRCLIFSVRRRPSIQMHTKSITIHRAICQPFFLKITCHVVKKGFLNLCENKSLLRLVCPMSGTDLQKLIANTPSLTAISETANHITKRLLKARQREREPTPPIRLDQPAALYRATSALLGTS